MYKNSRFSKFHQSVLICRIAAQLRTWFLPAGWSTVKRQGSSRYLARIGATKDQFRSHSKSRILSNKIEVKVAKLNKDF